MCFAGFEGCVPTPSAAIFWLIFVMRSVSFQYRSMAAAPLFFMSSNTADSSGSSFRASSVFLRPVARTPVSACYADAAERLVQRAQPTGNITVLVTREPGQE